MPTLDALSLHLSSSIYSIQITLLSISFNNLDGHGGAARGDAREGALELCQRALGTRRVQPRAQGIFSCMFIYSIIILFFDGGSSQGIAPHLEARACYRRRDAAVRACVVSASEVHAVAHRMATPGEVITKKQKKAGLLR